MSDNILFNPSTGPTTSTSGPKKIVPFTIPAYTRNKNPVFATKPTIDSGFYQILGDSIPGSISAASSILETTAPLPSAAPLMQLLQKKNIPFIPNLQQSQENFSTTSIKEGMSFENGNGKMDRTTSITYNFSNATVYKRDIDFSSKKYLQVNNYTPKPSPNFTVTSFPGNSSTNTSSPDNSSTGIPKNCNSTTAYFYNVLHEIIGVTVIDESMTPIPEVVGELVINISDGNTTRYVCFILSKSGKNDIKDIDNFFVLNDENTSNSCSSTSNSASSSSNSNSNKLSLPIILNNSIPPQKWSIFYKDTNKTEIYVMTNPILVNNATSDFLNTLSNETTLFNTKFPSGGWSQIMKNSLYGDDEIYIDCQPTGESEKQVAMVALQNNTTVGGDSKTAYIISTLSIITIVLIITSVAVGKIFKFLFVDWLIKSSNVKITEKPLMFVRNVAISFFLLFAIGFICICDSISQNIGIIIVMYTAILFVFFVLHLYFNPHFLKKQEGEISLTDIIELTKDWRWINIMSMIKLCVMSFWHIFVDNKGKDEPNWGPIIIMGIYFLIIIIVYPIQISRSEISCGQAVLWSFIGFLLLSIMLKAGILLFSGAS